MNAREEAVKAVLAQFLSCWNALPQNDRGEFYSDVRLFMQFVTSTTKEYRAALLKELDKQHVR